MVGDVYGLQRLLFILKMEFMMDESTHYLHIPFYSFFLPDFIHFGVIMNGFVSY